MTGSPKQSALEAGAVGGILAVAVIAPHSSCALYDAWRVGDHAQAGAMQERIGPLHKTVVVKCGISGVKTAMDRVGLFGGTPRLPLPLADGEKIEIVEDALKTAGFGVSSEAF